MSTKTAIACQHVTSILGAYSLEAVMLLMFAITFSSGVAIAFLFNF